jgi:GAF domain-containing protein
MLGTQRTLYASVMMTSDPVNDACQRAREMVETGASRDCILSCIDRLKPNARVGTCAAAAATASVVVTPDFLADDKWAELKHLPRSLGYVGAWSMPIKSPRSGAVLGTFGTYYRDRREPTPGEISAISKLAAVAALALERDPVR